MDRLLSLRQREARTSGRAVTSLASLPSELVAKIVEYNERCKYRSDGRRDSWLGRYLTFACVSKSCLEALRYVSTLRINFPWEHIPSSDFAGTGRGTLLDVRHDATVTRWCDIVSRRFRNVLRVQNDDAEVRKTFNAAQTVAIVDCVASFPHLQEFELWAGTAIAASDAIKAHVRAGRFQNLRCLRFHCKTSVGREWHGDLNWNVGESSRLPIQLVKPAVRSLMSDLPVDLCLDVLLWGIYPKMALIDDEMEAWASMFFDLVARGADVHSRRILWEVALNFPCDSARLNVLCDMVEKLLVVHGADPNCMASDPFFYEFRSPYKYVPPVLWEILDWLSFQHGFIVGDVSIDSDDSDADLDNEQLAQVLMRIIDVLVRHGGRCSADDTPRGTYNKRQDFLPWILSRSDCTAAIRDAVNQGNLVY